MRPELRPELRPKFRPESRRSAGVTPPPPPLPRLARHGGFGFGDSKYWCLRGGGMGFGDSKRERLRGGGMGFGDSERRMSGGGVGLGLGDAKGIDCWRCRGGGGN